MTDQANVPVKMVEVVCVGCNEAVVEAMCRRCVTKNILTLIEERDTAIIEVQRLREADLQWHRSFDGHVYVKNEEYAALCEATAEVQRLRGVGMDLCNELLNYEPMLTDIPTIQKLVAHYVAKLTSNPSTTT